MRISEGYGRENLHLKSCWRRKKEGQRHVSEVCGGWWISCMVRGGATTCYALLNTRLWVGSRGVFCFVSIGVVEWRVGRFNAGRVCSPCKSRGWKIKMDISIQEV